MLQSNPPTAYAMLRYTIPQPEGAWVVQNLSNSGVGIAVIQVAKRLGMRTVNIVRREGLAEQLTALGADRVLVGLCGDFPDPHTALTAACAEQVFDDGDDVVAAAAQVKEATGGAKIGLALNGTCGECSKLLLKCLATGGTMLTYTARLLAFVRTSRVDQEVDAGGRYGAMSRAPVQVGGGQLIFKDLRLQGFHLGIWNKQHGTPERLEEMWWASPLALSRCMLWRLIDGAVFPGRTLLTWLLRAGW